MTSRSTHRVTQIPVNDRQIADFRTTVNGRKNFIPWDMGAAKITN